MKGKFDEYLCSMPTSFLESVFVCRGGHFAGMPMVDDRKRVETFCWNADG